MLAPDDRRVLLDALRPPDGYVVDRAIATTYSLDLVALLTAPLAFSLYDRLVDKEEGGPRRVDGFGLLKAVRDHAERLSVFCHAGCIAAPPKYRQLFPYLEGSVVQARARADGGVFHPKVWALRFTRDGEPVRYRLLVASRNLTFDRCWDTLLAMDGELRDRSRSIARSQPIGEFVAALPALALQRPSKRIVDDVELVADELRRVDFEVPEGFEDFRFWPLGHDGKRRWPFETRIDRLLVVSPFVAGGTLERLTANGKGHVLCSREEELEPLHARSLAGFNATYVLDEAASPEPEDEELTNADPAAPPPTGLHAKLYVADDGWDAHVWTGSANASAAAFGLNVELLVQLDGKKSVTGVEAVLDGAKGRAGMRSLLVPYKPPISPKLPSDIDVRLERALGAVRDHLARTSWAAVVTRDPGEQETYRIDLEARGDGVVLPAASAEIRAWPISLPETFAQPIHAGTPGVAATFAGRSFGALTSFFAFEVVVSEGDASTSATFVVHVPLEGAPPDRQARVLQALLDDPAKVLRFLRMLLATDAFEALAALEDDITTEGTARGHASRGDAYEPLLESLLRAADREPERLEAVDRLVRELRATPEGAKLLPAEFDRIWLPIWEATRGRKAVRK